MKLTRYASPADFLKRARAPLEAHEAANNLIIGIPARALEQPGVYKHGIYLATVDEGDTLLAAAVRTPPFRVIVYNADEENPAPLHVIIEDVLAFSAEYPPDSPASRVSGVTAHSATALAFAEAWSARTGQRFKPGMSQRIYELRKVTPPQNVPGHLRPARADELELIADWTYNFSIDAVLPADREEARTIAERRIDAGDVFLWEHDGRPVSVAAKGRNSSHGITVNLVYTPPELRNRGYASACVAALSQQLLDAGWEFCTLYTDLANPTSNSIYQRIGYRPVCDSNEYVFVND
jgi:predicted GNAT family acetyltransferase